ncbi:hydroxyneurosporene synthase [Luminiphilus syltensis NOR5-1B]|uniref:Hydroxyneurosporene synthase n=1 Tax=Luminiphilus syltensis NOR5-1B TaxID=565045 RepID=B8KT18_9GAMM|nr:carotenoid 1,2-hydratase [Luminiphilus syltensis]EED35795.1 hydroxyneurosporene synthase [Luminiphilus syltensis NOR5-1B]
MPDVNPESLPDSPAQGLLADTTSLGFAARVPRDGYRWWYIDAFSPDGRWGLTVIAFIGCVFSPYYASARDRGEGDPENHCSVNAILYGPGRKRWALTERNRESLRRDDGVLRIGPSQLNWDGSRLEIEIDEVTVPLPSRLRGRIRVDLPKPSGTCFSLDTAGHHRWWPIAPRTAIDVDLSAPSVSWKGNAYVDCNAGAVPLERTFRGWHWLRTEGGGSDEGRIFYQTRPLSGEAVSIALAVDSDGASRPCPLPDESALRATPIWRMPRPVSSEALSGNTVVKTFEDTPFYSRSKVGVSVGGAPVEAMHESLDLHRFRKRWVQTLLPFRMPRRGYPISR